MSPIEYRAKLVARKLAEAIYNARCKVGSQEEALEIIQNVVRPEVLAIINEYEEVLTDKRRLARQIDVALHGEAGAAQQASLCDLVGPAKALSDSHRALVTFLQTFHYTADGKLTAFPDAIAAGRTIEAAKKVQP